jgi:hypothetical protein
MGQQGVLMHRWQKTVMEWECHLGLETDIPVTDWHKPEEKFVHKVHEIKATALPARQGQVEVRLQRVAVSPTTERKTILARLSDGLKRCEGFLIRYDCCKHLVVKNEDDYSGMFTIEFSLENGEQFCDTSIKIVGEVLKLLGIKDESGYRLANFTISQETFIQLDLAWITFAHWLRIQHRLPIFCSADTRVA